MTLLVGRLQQVGRCSWKSMVNDYLDDPGFMNLFNIYVIDHIQNNFERFTVQEGNSGDINQVDFELVAAMLAGYSERFRK